jgi:hypothetical protein
MLRLGHSVEVDGFLRTESNVLEVVGVLVLVRRKGFELVHQALQFACAAEPHGSNIVFRSVR